ncbi:MAG TPA: hypothetical protein VIP70_10190 [Nitrososphaeraceae archaeon]
MNQIDKSINNLSERLREIESQEIRDLEKTDPELLAKQRYQEYKEHWYFHKSSWYMRGLNAYDGQGCNGFTGCIPECKFYAEEGKLSENESFS